MPTFSDYGIHINSTTAQTKTTCPRCSDRRTNKTEKCLSVNPSNGVWHCHHCGWAGGLASKAGKIFVKPDYKPANRTASKMLDFFTGRGIGAKTIEKFEISLRRSYLSSVAKEVDTLIFPFKSGMEVLNVKYRALSGKIFQMEKGAEKILYNLDAIIEGQDMVIVEGEIDAMSIHEAGYSRVVSVPNGAPSPGTKSYASALDYLDSAMGIIDKIPTVIIATDNDEPGIILEQELARRVGVEKCKKVTWPEGCKDANEVLCKHDKKTLLDCIANARDYPIKGIFSADDIKSELWHHYDHGDEKGADPGWYNLNQLYTVRPGEMTVVTGIPSHGKSELVDAMMINIAEAEGWRFGIFSPENQPLHIHARKLIQKKIGKPVEDGWGNGKMSKEDYAEGINFVDEKFRFILPGDDDDLSLNAVLDLARIVVRRSGITGLVLDPWNELDHSRGGLSETEYISQSLSKIRRFARNNGIHVWVVAHPAKLFKDKDGSYPCPTPYDISGSAHWRNKADNCLAVYRPDFNDTKVKVQVQKVRFRAVGRTGEADLEYSPLTGKYNNA